VERAMSTRWWTWFH